MVNNLCKLELPYFYTKTILYREDQLNYDEYLFKTITL